MTEDRIFVRCICSHVWPLLQLPASVSAVSAAVKAAACPACGAGSKHMTMASKADVEAHKATEQTRQSSKQGKAS